MYVGDIFSSKHENIYFLVLFILSYAKFIVFL